MAENVTQAAAPQISAGLPVEIGRIERELKKLWDQSGGAMTRASLINLAVYSESPGSLAKNTELLAKVTEDHACRAIVIGADPTAKENRVEAWISAHCHVSRAGSKQICSEQLSFCIEGASTALLPNIVFSHLDSDLPLYLWWQGEFHDPMDAQLWAWVDRLIYDSQTWSNFAAQMKLIETAQAEAKQRVVLCDLNWTRIVQLRLALAQFFDCPSADRKLESIDSVEVDFAPEYRSTAVLLVGWFAAQLKWAAARNEGDTLVFTNAEGKRVGARLTEKGGEPISRYAARCGETEFVVSQAPDADLLDVSVNVKGERRMRQLMPAGRNDPARLMSEELMRGGPHRVYLRAVNCVRSLL
jgi:glucose-6-phosphate dehydrogenase assembly protein OpcA